jgi:ABC-type sugar transport system substrate-binding protein
VKRNLVGFLLLAMLRAVQAAPADAATSAKRIAFSNNYAGNSWRQAMLKSFNAGIPGWNWFRSRLRTPPNPPILHR